MFKIIEEKKKIDERELVIFSLAEEEFGVDIKDVREINRMEKITPIPNSPNYIRGVVNLRGAVVVVVCLATKFGLVPREETADTRILIIEINDMTLGLVVDSAEEVLRLTTDKLQSPPETITDKIHSDFIENVGIIGERLVIMLNMQKIFKKTDADKAALAN